MNIKNFGVKLTQTQWSAFGGTISKLGAYSYGSITLKNYAHVYNTRSLLTKIVTRIFNAPTNQRKELKVTITPNEINTLRYMVGQNLDAMQNLTYESSVFACINAQINKQEINYVSTSYDALNLTFLK